MVILCTCSRTAEGSWCMSRSHLDSTATSTLHNTLTFQFQEPLYVTKPNVIASFLCETTNFCVPFLRTWLLKCESICVQCTENIAWGSTLREEHFVAVVIKSHTFHPYTEGRWNILFECSQLVEWEASTGKSIARVPLTLWSRSRGKMEFLAAIAWPWEELPIPRSQTGNLTHGYHTYKCILSCQSIYTMSDILQFRIFCEGS